MLYAILCCNDENVVGSWTKQEDDAGMARLAVVHENLDGALAVARDLAEANPSAGGYFHFFGVEGALLMRLGRDAEARTAFDRAIALANTAAEAAHIRQHLDRLTRDGAAAPRE